MLHVVGIFFVLPCIERYTKVDLRTVSFDVPPQEVSATVPGLYQLRINIHHYYYRRHNNNNNNNNTTIYKAL